MVSQITAGNEWLTEYVDQLVQLHRLIANGQGDSAAADTVRDGMDVPWRNMSEAEIELAGDLSIDLYTITDPPSAPQPLQPEFKFQINEAIDQQRYADALRLLRKNAAQLDLSVAAFVRGICWSGLGLASAAAEFFLHAERQQPGMAEARLCALSTLITGKREAEALAPAQRWAAESQDPSLVLKAAEVVFLNAVRLPLGKAANLYQQVISLAERALRSYEAGPSDPTTEEQVIVALLQIAVSYARLGDTDKAREFCSRARKRSPDSVIAMTVDGMLNKNAPPASDEAQEKVVRQIGEALPGPSQLQHSCVSFTLN